MNTKLYVKGLALAAASALALGACATDTKDKQSTAESDTGVVTLKVGATPVPHKDILQFVQDNLAAKAGLNLDIVEYNDYVQPNVAVDAGDLDANFFQHVPYLEDFNSENGTKLTHGEGIHVEPMGLYSQKFDSVSTVPEGVEVAIPNDASNGARALKLLADHKFFTLDPSVDLPTPTDIKDNPQNIKVTPTDAANLPGLLSSVDFAVINSNFAAAAGIVPSKDSIAIEATEGNPYANVLAWNPDSEKLAAITKLDELLHSPEVAQFIKDYNKSTDESGNTTEIEPWLLPAF